MRIEFKTVYDSIENEKLGQVYVKHCIENQMKQYKKLSVFTMIVSILAIIIGFFSARLHLAFTGILFLIVGLLLINRAKKKLLPKSFSDVNGVGCPYNVTIGLYDEYFYEKFENNMSISENSVRYEFLKKVVETPEYFVLLTQRSHLYFLPKRDMGYENVLEFSAFCKARLPYIYKVVN